ncbi:MAG: HD domain-containing protein [Candidatus Omnitrophica bacterium]|jgi:putative nucleotidyltransferase with HDIG domain|nr:HD domain-containing protein [Candidatus Omnitrophota bacterium]
MALGGKILFLCDDRSYTNRIREELSDLGNYTLIEESTAQAAVISLEHHICDLVIIRYAIPELDILSAITDLKKVDPDCMIVVLLEVEDEGQSNHFAEVGIFETLGWPVKADKLKFVVEKGIKLHGLLTAGRKMVQGLKENNRALEKQNTLLAKRIEDSTSNLSRLYEDLRSTYMRTIRVLAQAIDARDHYTHSHSENVARYAVAICNQLRLPAKEVELIRQACELHDLGKIGIGDSILLKPSALTSSEWEQIKKHPTIGAQILEPLTFLGGVVDLVRQHHEHYDGSGYPEGRKGEDILLGARIIHVADSYEAMRSARSYRKIPLMKEEAILEIKLNSGTQFDPKIVDAFLKVVDNL